MDEQVLPKECVVFEVEKELTRPVEADLSQASVCLATFMVGGVELGLELKCLREAIDIPKELVKVPLSSDHCQGIFNLRGEIIPLVNLQGILNYPYETESDSQKAVIAISNGKAIGMRVDSTGSIVSYTANQIHRPLASDEQLVISGIVRDERRSGGILQVLDAQKLMTLPGMPILSPNQRSEKSSSQLSRGKQRSQRQRFIRFELEGLSFALRVADVVEVYPRGVIHPARVSLASYFLGLVTCRQSLIPLLDTAQLLWSEPRTSGKREHVIVVQHAGVSLALLVDEIREFVDVDDNARHPVPLISSIGSGPVFDQLLETEAAPSLSISIEGLIESHGIRALLNTMRSLDIDESSKRTQAIEEKKSTAAQSLPPFLKAPILVFSSRRFFATPIGEIREIVPYPTPLIDIPGHPAGFLGVLSLRGHMAPVVDLSALIWNEPFSGETGSILVLEDDGGKIGAVLVDSVDEIVRLQQRAFNEVPPRLAGVGSKFPAQSVLATISLAIQGSDSPIAIIALRQLVGGLVGEEDSTTNERPAESSGIFSALRSRSPLRLVQ